MIGVRLPSRVVRTDFMRGLLFVAAVMAVGVGYRGHGLQGAAKSKSEPKFVDPFLAEDVAAPGDDEIPRIPDVDSPPERERRSEPEVSADPPLDMDLEYEREASPQKERDTKVPASLPEKVPAKAARKAAGKVPVKADARPDLDSAVQSVPGLELEGSEDPKSMEDSQSMPKVQAPRLPRAIKKTATPKLDADQDLLPDGDLGLPGGGKNQPQLRALKNVPNLGKPAWKSTAVEPAASTGDSAKAAADGPPDESARFERSGNIEDLSGTIDKIIIEGNKTIKTEEIKKLIKTREGRPADPKQIKEDVRTLVAKRWFFDVEPRIAQSKEGPGNVLVFKVNERPMLKKITYIGNKKIKEKALNEAIMLKVNGGYDVGANREAVHRILSLYQEKGYQHATVELEKGDSPEDREVVFKIDEGPKVVVNKISFSGNSYFSTAVLKTQIKTKKVILWFFGGKYDRSSVDEDVHLLGQYYRDLGFFDVQIRPKVSESQDKSKIHVEYVIEEGVRFKVRNIEFVGNRVIPEDKLREHLKVKPNDHYAQRFVNGDKDKIVAQYGELGRIFAKVDPRTRSFEEPGYVDLVYEINEDRPYRIGRIYVHINGDHPHTKESAVLTKLTFKPGELASMAKIEKSKQRLKGCGLFAGGAPGQANTQQGASPPDITLRPSDLPVPQRSFNVVRGQDDAQERPRRTERKPVAAAPEEPSLFRGQDSGNAPFDSLPFSDSQDGPPPGTFVADEPLYIDPIINVFETTTGRINMGVGVNSNAGLLGNVTLEENNFDITRFPTSMQDVVDGTAFRGGGQQFRVEAMPGLQLSRYSISWRDPYFLNQNVMLGVSGQYYNRYFYNWTERREGGRVTLGHQFDPNLSGSITVRAEGVKISNPSVPIPPDYLAVLGENFLSTVLANVTHDTRDHPMLPGSGHFVQATFEEGIANFVYQKYQVDARQHFLVKERPDGGSRHVLSLYGNVGWIGTQAPFFERFFAGGFGMGSTFRGFQYQGVGPRYHGVRIGGEFQALGTVEYQIPITADNTVQIVTFTDFGTVDSTATFNDYRQSVGAGLRLTVPMLGPVPIAIDFAVPITRQPFDSTQVISFNMSGGR